MKKAIFILAAGALALSACTSIGVIEEGVQGGAIGFQSVVSKATRATDLTKNNLNKFYVYSYYTKAAMTANPVNVFDGEEITLKDGAWGYTNTRYWVPDATYYFYAYSCGNNEMTETNGVPGMDLNASSINERALQISDFISNSTHQHDLIFASNEGYVGMDSKEGEVTNAKVGFRFKHVLTKVNAKFESDFAPGYDIVISNVKITNIRDKGDFNPKAGENESNWQNVERTVNNKFVELALTAPNNVASAAENEADVKIAETATAFVIPHEYSETDVKLTFTIEVKQGNDTFLSRNMEGTWKPNWKMGYSYTYNIKITGTTANLEPIVFETAENMNVDDFTTGTAPDITFSAN